LRKPTSVDELELQLAPYSKTPASFLMKKYLEQYQTPTDIAARMAWTAYMKKHLESSTVLDMGCGMGVLTIAAVLNSAKRSICLDIDAEILEAGSAFIKDHYSSVSPRIIFVCGDATELEFNGVDVVLMNPPFGVVPGNRGLDTLFLISAFRNSRFIYSLHKYSKGFVNLLRRLTLEYGYAVTWFELLDFKIPMTYPRHRRRVYRVKTLFIGLERE